MKAKVSLQEIQIRTELKPGDLGYIIFMHGALYKEERGYTSSYLWTTKELDSAARLYKKNGFELTIEKSSTAFGKEVIEQRYDYRLQRE